MAYALDGSTVNPIEIKSIRTRLGLTQTQFAQLLGAHPLTVWKWEKGDLQPTLHQQGLITSFGKASQNKENIGSEVGALLVTAGVVVAIYALLHAAFGDKK